MAPPLVTYEGYSGLMAGCVVSFASGNHGARVRLFQNNLYPTKLTILSDFVEANFAGYAPQLTTSAIDEGLSPGAIDVWKFAAVTFVMSALPMQAVFGYWVDFVNPMSGVPTSLWCQRFDQPFLFNAPGAQLPITLTPGFSQG